MEAGLAVWMYTLLELTRRRVLLIFVVIGIVLMAGLGLAPAVVPGLTPTAQEREIFVFSAVTSIVSTAIALCAYAIGATVLNHDLDSGAVIAIFAKPVTRLSYAVAKLAAAAALLVFLEIVFAVGSIVLVQINGGGHMFVLLTAFVVSAANVFLLAVLVMIFNVWVNNIVAALIAFGVNTVAGILATLHQLAGTSMITSDVWRGVINFFYWLVPHALESDLGREIVRMEIGSGQVRTRGGPNPLDVTPGASGLGDVAFWLGYLVVLCGILYFALRRKQV